MFSTELHLITVISILIGSIAFIIQFAACLSRPKDRQRTKFFILTSLFIYFILSNSLLPDSNSSIPTLIQIIITYVSSAALSTYYFFYLVEELKLKSNKYFNTKLLFTSQVISFFTFFLIPYLITKNLKLSMQLFIIPLICIAIYFSIRTVLFIYKNQKVPTSHYKLITLSGYLGIVFMALMPIIIYFRDYQPISHALIIVSFGLSAFTYYKNQLYVSKIEYKTLNDLGFYSPEESDGNPTSIKVILPHFELTPKEIEVSNLILENLTYREIGERLNIVNNTVSKHASNIYKKTNCGSKQEFIDRYIEEEILILVNEKN